MFILAILSLLALGNGYYLTPFKVITKNFNKENIKIYEPLNVEDNKNVLFFTGANSLIPGEVYSSFLTNVAQYNMTIFVCSSNIDTSNVIYEQLNNNNETVVVGHSTGCINALDFCNNNENIKKIVLMDPVDNSYIYNKKYNNVPIKFKNNLLKRFVDTIKTVPLFDKLNYEEEPEINNEISLKYIENSMFLNAKKSYTWDLFDKKFPFIPAFAITSKKINYYNENVKSISIFAKDFGHTDILDEIWANNMHTSISRGTDNRSSENLSLYHKWLATLIYIFSNKDNIDLVLKEDEIIKKIDYIIE